MATRRPGGLTAICVIAIILGCLSTCATLWGYAGAAITPMMQSWQQQQVQQSGAQIPQWDEMQSAQDEMMAQTRRFTPIGLALSTLGMSFGLGLLVAASLALAGKPIAAKLLVPLLGAGIGFEVLHAAAGVWIQIQTQAIMERYMGRIMTMSQTPGQPPPPAEMESIMSGMMGASVAFGICIAVGWALAKISYYGWSIAYLRKPEVRAHLTGDQASAEAGLVA